jgi:hypothetical protein
MTSARPIEVWNQESAAGKAASCERIARLTPEVIEEQRLGSGHRNQRCGGSRCRRFATAEKEGPSCVTV